METNDNSKTPSEKYYTNPYIGSLRNILVAFAYYSIPKSENGYGGTSYTIGYCQSLNYIAGLLLLIFSLNSEKKFKDNTTTAVEEMCFWVFATLIDKILPKEMYGENGMEGAIIEQELLWNLIIDENGRKFGVKKVAKWKKDMEKKNNIDGMPDTEHLTKLGILTFKWMTTCFVGVLPIETVLRVWDCIFTEGYITILRVTLTLLRIYENDISKNDDELEGWDFINNLPYKIIDCHRFMEICFRPKYSINPLKNLYYSINFVNPITNQLELKKTLESNNSSKQLSNSETENIKQQQQQQHEMQQQQHQEQLFQVLQNQQNQNQKQSSHQRNKSFSSFLSMKYKNQQNGANNGIGGHSKQKSSTVHTIESHSHDHSNKSFSYDNYNDNEIENENDNENEDENEIENESSFSDYSENMKEVERKADDFFPQRSKSRSHNKSYSENTNKSNKYNYDSINNSNFGFEGSLYNKISSAINRKFSSNKKIVSRKNSYKGTKKSDTEANKKKSGKKGISNFDVLKRQLENISPKKKNDDSTERLKKSGSPSKDKKLIKNSKNKKVAVVDDNQTTNSDNNKNYYNSLNESINNSINLNSASSVNCDSSVTSFGKPGLNGSSYSNFAGDEDDNSSSDSECNKTNKIVNNETKVDSTEDDKKDINKKDGDLIIVKPLCQINTGNDISVSSPIDEENISPLSNNDYNDKDIKTPSEVPRRKSSGDSKKHLRNKVLKYKNKSDKNDKENVISLFNNGLTVSSSVTNNMNYLSDEERNSFNRISNNEKVTSSDESLTKSKGSDKDNQFNMPNNALDSPTASEKKSPNSQRLDIPCSPSLSVASHSSASTQSTDITCSSMSYSMSEDEDEDEDDEDDQIFFSINELTGTINGDLIKLNEDNKINMNTIDSNSVNSGERTSFMSINNDIIIKTIEEKLKEKIIDKQQNFKYLDLLNGSKIGSYSRNNGTRHKRNALSYQYDSITEDSTLIPQNNYYSLSSIHRKTKSSSYNFNFNDYQQMRLIPEVESPSVMRKNRHSLDDSGNIENSKDFHSFVDIYCYQLSDKNKSKDSGSMEKCISNRSSLNDKNLKTLQNSSLSNDEAKKTHYTLDTNGVMIDQNNTNVKAKGPDICVYCSNDVIQSPLVNSNKGKTVYSVDDIEDSPTKQKGKKLSTGSDTALLKFEEIETGALPPTYSQSTASSSNEFTAKPVIILSSEKVDGSNVKYYISPDGSSVSLKSDKQEFNKDENKDEKLLNTTTTDIKTNDNEYNNNINTNKQMNDQLDINTKGETSVVINTTTNNNNNVNNNYSNKSANQTEDESDRLSQLQSSSNNDLIEQIQVFWRVTFPKNEGYHLVLRKGGIGNLSNKVINKYRKKLWEKRKKEKMKNNNT